MAMTPEQEAKLAEINAAIASRKKALSSRGESGPDIDLSASQKAIILKYGRDPVPGRFAPKTVTPTPRPDPFFYEGDPNAPPMAPMPQYTNPDDKSVPMPTVGGGAPSQSARAIEAGMLPKTMPARPDLSGAKPMGSSLPPGYDPEYQRRLDKSMREDVPAMLDALDTKLPQTRRKNK
tara:strand:- start:1095 stop:1628 length:534 start_codon:yes stop_codon:yes gene_type:complete